MKVGFSDTRHGCTPEQLTALSGVLLSLGMSEFRHGDCIGADAQAHSLLPANVKIYIYPSNLDNSLRAFCNTGNVAFVHSPQPPLKRNKVIVENSRVIIACPASMHEEPRGGTWYTVRYARACGRPIILVMPDGSVRKENVP